MLRFRCLVSYPGAKNGLLTLRLQHFNLYLKTSVLCEFSVNDQEAPE